MANSGSEKLEPMTNFAPRTIDEHSAITSGRSPIAGVFFWKKSLHDKISKKTEYAQKNENSSCENTARRKLGSVSTSRMMLNFLGNIRKHLRIEKLSSRNSRPKVHDAHHLRVENSNTILSDSKEWVDGLDAIQSSAGAQESESMCCASTTVTATATTGCHEETCSDSSDQQLDREEIEEIEEMMAASLPDCIEVEPTKEESGKENSLDGKIDRHSMDVRLNVGNGSPSEHDYEASNESKAKANLTEELLKLSKYGWYWGPISGDEADAKLISEPDGAFLVRDSSDDRYLLTLSFKSSGKLLHARMDHSGGLFSLCNHGDNEGFTSVAALIDHSMNFSQSAVFCYSRPKYPGYPSFPVRLTKPVSRFTRVRSLQYLCRFVIRQNTRLDNIRKLPLPRTIKGYIEEAHF